jgi:hypothetical protein
MSETRPPESGEPQPPPQRVYLQYQAPGEQEGPAGGVPFIGQLAIGFGAFLVCGAMIFVTGALWNWTTWTPLYPIAWLSSPLLLVGMTVVAWRRWRWRGFLVGVLIGVGLLGLAIGACFAIVFSKGF